MVHLQVRRLHVARFEMPASYFDVREKRLRFLVKLNDIIEEGAVIANFLCLYLARRWLLISTVIAKNKSC